MVERVLGIPLVKVVLLSLIGRTGVREVGRVSYELIRQCSSRDEGGEDNSEEEGGGISLVSSRLWWTRAQSCCIIYSAMNARGMT